MGVVWIFKPKEGATIEDVTNELINNKLETNCLESILLMVLNNSETWENSQEVEFNRSDALLFLEEYFKNKDYDKKYIRETLEKL